MGHAETPLFCSRAAEHDGTPPSRRAKPSAMKTSIVRAGLGDPPLVETRVSERSSRGWARRPPSRGRLARLRGRRQRRGEQREGAARGLIASFPPLAHGGECRPRNDAGRLDGAAPRSQALGTGSGPICCQAAVLFQGHRRRGRLRSRPNFSLPPGAPGALEIARTI